MAVGLFSGLVDPDEALNGRLGGIVNLVTTATGSFSGSFRLRERTYGFHGQLNSFLNADPSCQVSFYPGLEFDFSIDRMTGELSGTLSYAFGAATPADSVP